MTELWDEIIEVSTYGPSERKMLKAQRERQQQQQKFESSMQSDSFESFSSTTYRSSSSSNVIGDSLDDDSDEAWINAFQSAKSRMNDNDDGNLDIRTASLTCLVSGSLKVETIEKCHLFASFGCLRAWCLKRGF